MGCRGLYLEGSPSAVHEPSTDIFFERGTSPEVVVVAAAVVAPHYTFTGREGEGSKTMYKPPPSSG